MLRYWLEQIEKKAKNDMEKRTKVGILAAILGLFTNFLLFAGKISIGLISGSVSIMADAMNSLTDTASSVLTLIGFRISSKPPDKEHPYGHERFETISGLFISIIITYVGFQFMENSVKKIIDPANVYLNKYIFIVLILSIVLKIVQGRIYQKLSKQTHSDTLKASAKDSYNDVFTTLAVLLSAFVEQVTGLRVDGYIGFLLAAYILFSGGQMIKDFVDELMGRRPTKEEIKEMEEHIEKISPTIGYHDLLVHSYGPNKKFASVHIEVDENWTLNKAHKLVDRIEEDFKKSLDVNLVCHVDPIAIQDAFYQKSLRALTEIIRMISPSLRIHDFRIIKKDTVLQFDIVVPEDFLLSDEELEQLIAPKIKEKIGVYQIEMNFDHNYLL
ncbi:MAG: cation diffusion facilitator family transporter [Enterococcus sp.]